MVNFVSLDLPSSGDPDQQLQTSQELMYQLMLGDTPDPRKIPKYKSCCDHEEEEQHEDKTGNAATPAPEAGADDSGNAEPPTMNPSLDKPGAMSIAPLSACNWTDIIPFFHDLSGDASGFISAIEFVGETQLAQWEQGTKDDAKRILFQTHLKGAAAIWYEWDVHAAAKKDWVRLRTLFLKDYGRDYTDEELQLLFVSKIRSLKQGENESFFAYISRADEIAKFCRTAGLTVQLGKAFVDGLLNNQEKPWFTYGSITSTPSLSYAKLRGMVVKVLLVGM